MTRVKRERNKRWKRRRLAQSATAGTLTQPQAAHSVVRVISYDRENFVEEPIAEIKKLADYRDKLEVLWLDVAGVEDHALIQEIGKMFDIHHLVLEDVVSSDQRPKTEQYDDKLFILLNESGSAPDFNHRQIALTFIKGCVITFREEGSTCLEPVVERLRNRLGSIRDYGADYLVYSIVDAAVDTYFPALEHYGDELEKLEDEIIYKPSQQTIGDVHEIKRELLGLRRQMWPMREVINTLLRDGAHTFSQESIMHLRDCYDHAVQIIDFIETYRELGADLMDVYLSSISNRMNEVMKVLTIITTIFVPPTFIAGIYGMNFRNMPELNWYYGYPMVLCLMLVVSLLVVSLLWWKGFLSVLSPMGNRTSPRN